VNAHAAIAAEPPPAAEPSLARRANALARDLTRPSARIYWTDLALTAAVTYASLAAALAASGWLSVVAAAVCVLALYRGVSFIHELTHLRRDELPGFHLGWNLLIGVPWLTPSLLYEGVHILHHAKDRYGTARDPEYHPLARRPPAELLAFLLLPLLAPLAVLLRAAVLTPLGYLWPPLRRFVVARASGMVINPGFAREDFDRAREAPWVAQEVACWLWSWTLIGLTAAGVLPLRVVVLGAVVFALMTLLNQLRTAVAHYWENDGGQMAPLEQFLDTVNVPPPALLPALWAPVGLRYHALHHLMPRLPYHNLSVAHRRLVEALPADHPYRRVEQKDLTPALLRLVKRTLEARG
jgi:fatty acid desaturase